MTTNKKPAPGGNRDTGFNTAFNSPNDNPFALPFKALLVGVSAHDVALIALAACFAIVPLLAFWRWLP